MFSAKVPILIERVRLLEEHRRNILRLALWARRCEEIVGDYVHFCENQTDHFQYLHAQLIEQYNNASELVSHGLIAAEVATSLNDHLLEAIEDETHNLAVQSTFVSLEGHYDMLESWFSRQACRVTRLLVSLRVQRDHLLRKNSENNSGGSLPLKRKRKSIPVASTSGANMEQTD